MKKNIRQRNNSNKALLITLFIFAFSLTGCGGDSKLSNLTKKGLWERVGYGDVYKVDSNGKATKLYQFTRETCLDASSTIDSLPQIQIAFDATTLSNKKNTLLIENIDVSAFKISLQRLDKLPESCLDNRLIKTATANNMFDHFWHSFNDYYAFFDKRHVDWASQYAKYQPQVNENTSDEDLFEILSLMLTPLKDGHVNLESTNDSFNPELPGKAFLEIVNAFPQQNEFDEFDEFIQSVYHRFNTTIDSYLDVD
ncbi:MAG: hypothetical protein KAG34_04610, partial [Cocleimonas sp.]|nr:hypothetical protein [Cocleimonas sp.]